jgi:hypothetical protein
MHAPAAGEHDETPLSGSVPKHPIIGITHSGRTDRSRYEGHVITVVRAGRPG